MEHTLSSRNKLESLKLDKKSQKRGTATSSTCREPDKVRSNLQADETDNLDECQRNLIEFDVPGVSLDDPGTLSTESTCDKDMIVDTAAGTNAATDSSCDRVASAASEPAEWNLGASRATGLDDSESGTSWANAAIAAPIEGSDGGGGARGPTEIIINLPDPPSPSIRTRLRLRKPKSPPPYVQSVRQVRGRPKIVRPRRGSASARRRTGRAGSRETVDEDTSNKMDDEEMEEQEKKEEEVSTAAITNEQRRKLRKRVNCVSYREDSIVLSRQRTSGEGQSGSGSSSGGSNQREKVRCHECDKEFEKRYLKLHLQKHSGLRPHVCDVCQKSFISKYNVKLHKQRCHSDKKTFNCDLCRRTFSSKHAATEHRRTHTGEKPYRCRVCSREFSHMSAWTSHERTHNPTLLKVFLCDLCDKTFKHKRSLQKHGESVHQGIRKAHAYLCATCGQSYDSHSKLKVHQYRHTGERPFACSVCTKSFMTKDVLRNHALIHQDIKPFQCEFCGRKFRQAITFKRHRSTHTGLKPFVCQKCNKTFIHRVYMARHLSQNLCYKTRRGGSAAGGGGGRGGKVGLSKADHQVAPEQPLGEAVMASS